MISEVRSEGVYPPISPIGNGLSVIEVLAHTLFQELAGAANVYLITEFALCLVHCAWNPALSTIDTLAFPKRGLSAIARPDDEIIRLDALHQLASKVLGKALSKVGEPVVGHPETQPALKSVPTDQFVDNNMNRLRPILTVADTEV